MSGNFWLKIFAHNFIVKLDKKYFFYMESKGNINKLNDNQYHFVN